MNTNVKTVKILKTLFVLFVLCTSCNDDFLERYPESAVSDGVLWRNTTDLELYVNNLYNSEFFAIPYADASVGFFTLDRDNGADTQISRNFNTRMNGRGIIPATGGGWAIADWANLRSVNYFLANYGRASGEEEVINRLVGEVLFFKAIFYFGKLRQFGDVPWYDHLLNPDPGDENLFKSRDPRNVVVDHLMATLDKAVDYLPSRGENAAWNGRVNKETAMILQARIALFEGTWEKYHAGTPFGVSGSDGREYLEKAKDLTEALIAMGTCDLDNKGQENGYQMLFNRETYKGSKEVVFWREFNAGMGLANWYPHQTAYGALTGLSKRMVDSYLMNDGMPMEGHSEYLGDNSLLDIVANRDPRLNQTMMVNDDKHIRFLPDVVFVYPNFEILDKGCITGYQMYKGHSPIDPMTSAGSNSQSQIYFRYAEALLINAEAKAELGSITQADLDKTVNQLRRRLVGMADMKLTDVNLLPASSKVYPSLSNIINEIRRERTVELAIEGFRVDDIFRWAAADILIKGYVPRGAKRAQWEGTLPNAPTGYAAIVNDLSVDAEGYILPYAKQTAFPETGYNFNLDRDYLSPLPSDQLDKYLNLTQNPGWEE